MWVNRAVRSVALAAVIAVTMVASPGVASAAAHTHSPTFAGYQVTDVPTTGTATFTLPTLTCTPTNAGIVPSLVFTNFGASNFTSAGVYVQCLGGVPNYGSHHRDQQPFQLPQPDPERGATRSDSTSRSRRRRRASASPTPRTTRA